MSRSRSLPAHTRVHPPFIRMGMLCGAALVLHACTRADQSAGSGEPLAGEPLAASAVAAVPLDVASLPQFDRTLLLETTSETSANVSFGDVNGDGLLDIVLAKGRHWPLVDRVLLTDGRGNITRQYDLGIASDRSYAGLLADLDGDGDLDVVISNDNPDPKLVYLNDGTGTFRVGSQYGKAEWQTRNASVADLNNDGLLDIVVANRTNSGANFFCLNRGAGQFDDECTAFATEPTTTVTPADFNGDHLMDLAVPHRNGGQSFVYLAQPAATYSTARRIPFGPADAAIRMTAALDLDADGVLDLVAIHAEEGVQLYFGRVDGTFADGVPIAGADDTPYALLVRDLNGDGRPDIIVGNVEQASRVYFNSGDGRVYHAVSFGDGAGSVYGLDVADLDGDGQLDIAAARSDAPNIVFFGRRP